MFIICLNYILQTSTDQIKNGLTPKKTRSRQYPAETTSFTDNVDDVALLANAFALAESQKQAAERIGLYVNANQTEYICFN